MIRVKNIRAYRSNGPGYEEYPRESWSRTRKWCLPGARTGRDRGPPCRSRRRSRSEARNSRRSPPRPRSSFPPTDSRRGIASESTPSPRETFPRGKITCLPLLSLSKSFAGRENFLRFWKILLARRGAIHRGRRLSLLAGFRFGN